MPRPAGEVSRMARELAERHPPFPAVTVERLVLKIIDEYGDRLTLSVAEALAYHQAEACLRYVEDPGAEFAETPFPLGLAG